MTALKWNEYQGERCFIFGTGASLLWENQERVQDVLRFEATMGVNGLYLWSGMSEPPTWYCVTEQFEELWRDPLKDISSIKVVGLNPDSTIDSTGWERVTKYPDRPIQDGWFGGQDEELWVAGRQNVVWSLCVQLAYWLGFKEVYLLGVDGVYPAGHRLHCYELREFLMGEPHKADSFNPRQVNMVNEAAKVARNAYESTERWLINLNPDSMVTALPKRRLEDVL